MNDVAPQIIEVLTVSHLFVSILTTRQRSRSALSRRLSTTASVPRVSPPASSRARKSCVASRHSARWRSAWSACGKRRPPRRGLRPSISHANNVARRACANAKIVSPVARPQSTLAQKPRR